MRALLALGALAALLAAGCGGDDGSGPAAAAPVLAPERFGEAAPEPGRLLERFVAAAGEGDTRAMWALLSRPSKRTLGPTYPDFRLSTGLELVDNLGSLAGHTRLVLSRRLADGWGVAAVAGERLVDGENEYYAYAAALKREHGAWRLEIGGAVIGGLRPSPLDLLDEEPELGARVDASGEVRHALMWLDGEPVAAARDDDGPFVAHLSAEPGAIRPGSHVVVVFAATRTAAAATAWPFFVAR